MVSVLKDLADGMQRLQKISKDLSELELREEIVAQRELLLSAREEINSLREKNTELTGLLQEERAKTEFVSDLVEVEGFKYDHEDDRPTGLPYCPKCEVSENGKMFRLIKRNQEHSLCPNCDTLFNAAANGLVHATKPMPRAVNKPAFGRSRR